MKEKKQKQIPKKKTNTRKKPKQNKDTYCQALCFHAFIKVLYILFVF